MNSFQIRRPDFFNLRLSLLSKDCQRSTDGYYDVPLNAAQKFQRNKQASGGAYIPATVQVEGPREVKKAVLDKVRTFLAECENGGLMTIDIKN